MLKNWIIGKIGNKSKGQEYLKEVQDALSPESISSANPEEEGESKEKEASEKE